MIILASDYVGFQVVQYLIERNERIDFLILDIVDRGGYNQPIQELCQSYANIGTIGKSIDLQNQELITQIINAKPRIGILAWWSYLLKGPILEIPTLGWLNFHPSYLPFNRGKHPNFWCLVDETPAGATLHYIDEGIDTGDIVAQKRLEKSWEDTGGSIYQRSCELVIELFKKTYEQIIADQLPRREQDNRLGTFHTSNQMDKKCQIDINASYKARDLLNILRARTFPPYPTAYFYENGKKYAVEIVIKEIQE